MTTLTQRLDDYLAVRRSLGFDLSFSGWCCAALPHSPIARASSHITADLFLRWKAAFGKANNNTWSARLGMVRVFAGWSACRGKTCEPRCRRPD